MKRLSTTALFIVMALFTTWAQEVNSIHSEGINDKSSKNSSEDNISQSATNATDIKRATDIRRREKMLNFVEHYRSLYDQKDLKSIQDFFGDDALIVTENNLFRTGSEGSLEVKEQYKTGIVKVNPEDSKVEYKVQYKTLFIKELEYLLRRKTPIKLSISDINVIRHPINPNFYSVQFIQDLRSIASNGNEQSIMKGEMMMIWLFPENGEPIIVVRILWPENTDPSIKIQLEDFNIH